MQNFRLIIITGIARGCPQTPPTGTICFVNASVKHSEARKRKGDPSAQQIQVQQDIRERGSSSASLFKPTLRYFCWRPVLIHGLLWSRVCLVATKGFRHLLVPSLHFYSLFHTQRDLKLFKGTNSFPNHPGFFLFSLKYRYIPTTYRLLFGADET